VSEQSILQRCERKTAKQDTIIPDEPCSSAHVGRLR